MKPAMYKDDSIAPIVAFDFDGTISIGGKFPSGGEPRPYVREVMNFLIDIGVKVIIYTSRDVAVNQEKFEVFDDLTPMIEFLNRNGIQYSAINKSVQFAPFNYNSRKIYAHMYVDDRAYGWNECVDVMPDVLKKILMNILGMPEATALEIIRKVVYRKEAVNIESLRNYVSHYWK